MPGTFTSLWGLDELVLRLVRRYGLLGTAAGGGLATAAASSVLCYGVYLALGTPFTPIGVAMPIVAPLILAPMVILLLATALQRADAVERAHARALDASGLVIWEADLRAGRVSLGEKWAEFIGQANAPLRYTVAELARLVHPEDLPATVRAQMDMLKGIRAEYAAEHRVRTASGEWRWVLSRGRVTERDPASGRALRASGTNLDITERKRAEEALRRSEANLAAGQAMAHVGNWEFDLRTDELSWSDEIYRIFGREPRSFTPRFRIEYLQATHPQDRDKLQQALAHVLHTRQPHAIDHRILRQDGSERVLHVHAQILHTDASGAVTRLVGVAQDVTERKIAERDLRRLNAKLEAALRELESFSSSVSHDLRAPARAMGGFARIALDEHGAGLTEAGRRYLERIETSANAMGEMVDGLLELSRLSRQEIVRTTVDLAPIVAGVWLDLAAAEPQRSVQLHVETGLRAQGDPLLLRSLLQNLLGNARKFTRHNPQAQVWVGRRPDGGFFVRDNGVGFDMDHAGKIFEPFRRLHTESEFEGHGIGLALCAKIVERHGGRIWAESAPGAGALFGFTLEPEDASAES